MPKIVFIIVLCQDKQYILQGNSCMFHGLSLLACSYSELTSETTSPSKNSAGILGWGIDHRKTSSSIRQHNTEKFTHKSLTRAEFEPTIPVIKLEKTI